MFNIARRHMVKTYYKTGSTKITIGALSIREAKEIASKDYVQSIRGEISPVDHIEIYDNKSRLVESYRWA